MGSSVNLSRGVISSISLQLTKSNARPASPNKYVSPGLIYIGKESSPASKEYNYKSVQPGINQIIISKDYFLNNEMFILKLFENVRRDRYHCHVQNGASRSSSLVGIFRF